MLKHGRVTKVKVLFLVLVFVFNFSLFQGIWISGRHFGEGSIEGHCRLSAHRDPMASKLSLRCSDHCVSRRCFCWGSQVQYSHCNGRPLRDSCFYPTERGQHLFFDHGMTGFVWEFIGSCGRSLTYGAQSSHKRHFSLTVACIPGQKRDSRALLMLLSTPLVCFMYFLQHLFS